ncbi:short-chain fatty acid transporter [Thermodesulforhabdus norvegica]|uniref:Short-chain fatty acids transporter n=1 Tax=Thermodesulforhabdus norvegica TaxID=39841 RepID=A0A1I4W352_9BACT|nr:short-chain fatty acid transporter [Thermodesulforhabdus norvegica]SFN07837.1 short-chain fatty acids transporter [Thermodesulforhabdus norvegica]
MLERMGDSLCRWAQKYMPDPMIFAILLTILTYVMGLIFTDSGPFKMITYWYDGFWTLLAFGMQMCIILVTGYALATTPALQKVLRALAGVPKTSGGAAALVAFVACVAGLINWGLGLIVGAIFALEVARQGARSNIRLHYPLIVAAGYGGLAIWHMGLSGSAPLLVATENHFLAKEIGIIPVSETLGSAMNLTSIAVMLILVPLVFYLLAPKDASKIEPIRSELCEMPEEKGTVNKEEWTFADRLENSVLLSLIIGLAGLVYIIYYFATKGFALNLNIVNFTFLILGILLHRRPIAYVRAVAEGVRGCTGIILQFPFYAGIMGMMKFSGLVTVIANWFVALSTPTTYPVFTFISAGLVNLFVPSGGGQWAVQGPIMVKAAEALNFSIPKTIMALAYGDQWTNLFQPFWALPLLGICGVRARDIMGYCMAVMFIGIPVYIILLLLF